MSYFTEQDPLLPKAERSPEIQGSRPSSINDICDVENRISEGDHQPARQVFNDFMAMIFGLCVIVSFAFIFLPDDVVRDRRPIPKTIEERVNRILTDTPLIGTSRYLI